MERISDLVQTDGRVSPLFSYLACAFRLRNRYDDLYVQEQRNGARIDLVFVAAVIILAVFAGMALQRFVLSWHG